MKRLVLFPLLFLVFSCATVNMSDHRLIDNGKFYNRYFVVFVETEEEFKQWDFENYEWVVKNNFNRLDNVRFRNQLYRTIKRNLVPATVMDTDDLFTIHEEVSFYEFTDQLQLSGADAILLVNLRTYYNEQSFVNGNSYTEPRAVVNTFLIDTKTMENIWISNSFLRGELYAGYDVLNNHLARKITKKLRKEGLLLPNPTQARY